MHACLGSKWQDESNMAEDPTGEEFQTLSHSEGGPNPLMLRIHGTWGKSFNRSES